MGRQRWRLLKSLQAASVFKEKLQNWKLESGAHSFLSLEKGATMLQWLQTNQSELSNFT